MPAANSLAELARYMLCRESSAHFQGIFDRFYRCSRGRVRRTDLENVGGKAVNRAETLSCPARRQETTGIPLRLPRAIFIFFSIFYCRFVGRSAKSYHSWLER
jgi:hypothetical protein